MERKVKDLDWNNINSYWKLFVFFSKWKSGTQPIGSSTVYQLAKLEAAAIYVNTETEASDFLKENWREELKEGLQTFSIHGKIFNFGEFSKSKI